MHSEQDAQHEKLQQLDASLQEASRSIASLNLLTENHAREEADLRKRLELLKSEVKERTGSAGRRIDDLEKRINKWVTELDLDHKPQGKQSV